MIRCSYIIIVVCLRFAVPSGTGAVKPDGQGASCLNSKQTHNVSS